MPLRLSREVVNDLFIKYLYPDELEFYPVYAYYKSGLLGTPLRFYLMALTNKRFLLMRVSLTFSEKDFRTIEFSEIRRAKVKNVFLGKKIKVYLTNGSKLKLRASDTACGLDEQKENLDKITDFLHGIK